MESYEDVFGPLEDCRIYLDNAATTSILPEVYAKMEPYIKLYYGNASSKHSQGEVSRRAIDEAREIIARAINCTPNEIYFTSGGTEANNWAIKGLKNKYKIRPMHIISSEFEHHSILESLKYRWNEHEDIEYTLIRPEKSGVINIDAVTAAFRLNTELCSIMMVNNEIGTIQPVGLIGEKCLDNGIIFHSDAVQAFGHIPIDVKKQNITMMSMASHKIHGPKGVGALYISNDVKKRILPFMSGGQQERGMRASTENVAGIVGFGKATELAIKHMENRAFHEASLRFELLEQLMSIKGVHVNGDIESLDSRHVNITIDGVRSEELMAMLDSVHVYVSAGSACNSESGKPSHVLKAIGLSDDQANASLRVSLDYTNTKKDIETFVGYLKQFIIILKER